MLAHEFFHEQAHVEKQHELKRRFFLLGILTTALITVFTVYKFFCYRQEYEADFIAAKKCGKENAVKSLKMLGNLRHSFLSLHPPTKKRIEKIYAAPSLQKCSGGTICHPVIARVQPEAIQCFCYIFWIASSLTLLAMTGVGRFAIIGIKKLWQHIFKEKIYGKSGTKNKKTHKSTLAFF